jgi:hypothetical protein
MMRNLTLKEKLLPQPPSFSKKTHYEIHAELGEGTFGKVMVCADLFFIFIFIVTILVLCEYDLDRLLSF